MSTATPDLPLSQQHRALAVGDYVTARFADKIGEYLVSGTVRGEDGCLKVGNDWLTSFPDGRGPHLVAIEAHEPRQPPIPPEPPSAAVLQDAAGRLWRKRMTAGKSYWTNVQGEALGGWAWTNPGMHRHGPFTVYHPEPSPERIDQAVTDFNAAFGYGDSVTRALRAVIEQLVTGDRNTNSHDPDDPAQETT